MRQILARHAPVQATETGSALFPQLDTNGGTPSAYTLIVVSGPSAAALHPSLPAWLPDVQRSYPLLALVLDGRAVAVYGSVPKSAHVHEAGVEVAAGVRGRGYAAHVVAAWARATRALGVEPLYSTDWLNTASRAVARTLGFMMYGDELCIS